MIKLLLLFLLLFVWMAYELWRAPVGIETKDGGWRTIRRTRTIKDLFKKKTNSSGSYSDLEKLRRGRSKH